MRAPPLVDLCNRYYLKVNRIDVEWRKFVDGFLPAPLLLPASTEMSDYQCQCSNQLAFFKPEFVQSWKNCNCNVLRRSLLHYVYYSTVIFLRATSLPREPWIAMQIDIFQAKVILVIMNMQNQGLHLSVFILYFNATIYQILCLTVSAGNYFS